MSAELVVIQTKGDRIQDRPLQSMGTGIFTKALDDACWPERWIWRCTA